MNALNLWANLYGLWNLAGNQGPWNSSFGPQSAFAPGATRSWTVPKRSEGGRVPNCHNELPPPALPPSRSRVLPNSRISCEVGAPLP